MPTNSSPASPSVSPIEEVGAARRREIAFQLSGLPRFNARAYREGKQCMWQHPGGVYVRWVDVVNFIESWNRRAPASLAQRSDDSPSVVTSLRRDPEPPTQAARDEIQSRYFPTTTGRECERCKEPLSAFEYDGESDANETLSKNDDPRSALGIFRHLGCNRAEEPASSPSPSSVPKDTTERTNGEA